ncbi:MAG: 3-hydroxyacyl-CoA dehydrogenase [Gammaproteobacteria bacterium]|nr:MAG: 3-hydroxyacyl-CoA dehydrogenase [Gammaproteobacteria bacterium]RLA49755.1 MAG: 3-hydroxyacyl-CoA dehydrogenase [Gammaproteobacteria bacterium]
MDVKGKSVVITGGASGLGAGTAALFVEQGAKVAVFDRNLELAEAIAKSLGCLAVQCDVADEVSVEAALDKATTVNGAPRIFINCAGIDIIGRIATRGGGPQPLEALSQQIAVNLTGTFNICRLGADRVRQLERLDAEDQGVIVNVASAAGLDGPKGQTAYGATKAAVIGMTLPMARDLAAYGVRVVTIAPGVFNTPLAAQVLRGDPEEFDTGTLFPKRAGKPAEFAAMALHICKNSMLNGEVIRLDGGLRAI